MFTKRERLKTMNAKYLKRLNRMNAILSEPYERNTSVRVLRAGKKKQRTRNVKLDRLQRNLTGSQSAKARSDFNYFAADVYGFGRDMFIG
jgi:hypothetical protein